MATVAFAPYFTGARVHLTVTREGDRLMTQATGQGKVEIFPSAETEFFLKVTDAQLTFVKGPSGSVDSIVRAPGWSRPAGEKGQIVL